MHARTGWFCAVQNTSHSLVVGSVDSHTNQANGLEIQVKYFEYSIFVYTIRSTFEHVASSKQQVAYACYGTNRKLWNIRSIGTMKDKVEIALVVKSFWLNSILLSFVLVGNVLVLVLGSSYLFYQMLLLFIGDTIQQVGGM